jgi:hypothetical protein
MSMLPGIASPSIMLPLSTYRHAGWPARGGAVTLRCRFLSYIGILHINENGERKNDRTPLALAGRGR